MARKSTKNTKKNDKNHIGWIITSVVCLLLLVFTVSRMGAMGNILNNICTYIIGSLHIVVLFTLFGYGVYRLFFGNKKIPVKVSIGLITANLFAVLLSAYIANNVNSYPLFVKYLKDYTGVIFSNESIPFSGGLIGGVLYAGLYSLFTRTGVLIILITLAIASIVLLVPSSVFKYMFIETKEATEEMIETKKKKKEEAKLALEKEEEERRRKIAEMNALQPKENEITAPEPEYMQSEEREELNELPLEPLEEVPVEEVKRVLDYDPEEILSKSPVWINLSEEEIYGKRIRQHHDPVVQTNDSLDIFINSKEKELVNEVVTAPSAEPREPKIIRRKTSQIYRLPKPVEEYLEPNNSKASSINKTSASLKGQKLIEILASFDIEAELLNTYIGPSVTKFEIKPKNNVRINRIMSISDNIKMELAARDIRIEAPIPGRSAVGIEIPNVEPIPVKMIDLMKKTPQDKKDLPLLFALGKDLMGESVFCNLAKMPHLLIAGATGSGKSVCINTIITSLLFRTKPEDVKMVLVDPKKVEFTPYKDVPHLLWPIIDDATMASNMLKRIVVLMEERYDKFAAVGVRNIETYNGLVEENNSRLSDGDNPMNKLPYIVVIIDELADLMAIAKKDVELSIQRITQLARASGIHLIVATQRPSTDVITGLIKSNIPSRISFAVASSIDSRTILDTVGAERLLGNGDMLYSPAGENSPRRLQGVYVTDGEIRKITSYVKSQAKPEYEDSYFEFLTNMQGTTVMSEGAGPNADSQDSLYDEVIEFVKMEQRASTSLLQRRFGIGYNRAARLIDTLEDRGIIGPSNGSKPREVYIKDEE